MYVCHSFTSKEQVSFNFLVAVETEQDPVVLAPCLPSMSSACLLYVENFSQRISLIREMRTCENKENSLRRLSNNSVVVKHSHGPLVLSQGL